MSKNIFLKFASVPSDEESFSSATKFVYIKFKTTDFKIAVTRCIVIFNLSPVVVPLGLNAWLLAELCSTPDLRGCRREGKGVCAVRLNWCHEIFK